MLDENRISIEVTFLYLFNQSAKNIELENSRKSGSETNKQNFSRLQNKQVKKLICQEMSTRLNFRTRHKTIFWSSLVTPKSINNEEFNQPGHSVIQFISSTAKNLFSHSIHFFHS